MGIYDNVERIKIKNRGQKYHNTVYLIGDPGNIILFFSLPQKLKTQHGLRAD